MRRRLAQVTIALLLLTGCLGRKTEQVIALEWWVTYPPDSTEYAALKTLADAYTAETGYMVDLVSVPWDEIVPRGIGTNRLTDAQAAGRGPDVWGPVPHNWTDAFAAGGQALALAPDQVQNLGQYLGVATEACQFDGQQYALPVLVDAVALIYNKALLVEPPESFEELLELTRSFTDKENDRWGLALPLLSQYHIYPFIDVFGGYVLSCEDNACDPVDIGLNGEGAVQGIQLLSDLYVKEGVFPDPLADSAVMYSYARRLFTEGRAAMLIEGSWALAQIRASGIDYGVAAIPRSAEDAHDARPLAIVQAVYASAHSAFPAQAVDFLNYLASPESVLAMQGVLGKTPVRRDVFRMAESRQNPDIGAWREQVSIGIPLPNMPDYVWTLWGQALEEAIPGLVPVQEALDRAAEQVQSYMTDE